jgi:Helix-turn-helix domain
MSIGATNAVWKRSGQKSGPLLVLLALADYTNSEGIAWPAVSTLAQKVRMSKRNVQRCVRALEKAGELEIRQNQGRRGSNIYRVLLSNIESNNPDAHVIGDTRVAQRVSCASLRNDTSVAQSVSKPLKESPPIVPSGDEIDFWIKICFRCFEQPVHDIPAHVLRELSAAIPTLDKDDADSLIDFYQTEPLLSKEPPYSSRRHSPERLILDLPRQLALAVQECPPPEPPPKYSFTLEDVCQYLREKYGDCRLPHSLEELDDWRLGYMRSEILEAMRMKNKKQVP